MAILKIDLDVRGRPNCDSFGNFLPAAVLQSLGGLRITWPAGKAKEGRKKE